ncbi:MAG: major capsid protein [Pseudonocardiaceae bacterium]
MTIQQLRELLERLAADATQVTSEELAQARAFIAEQRTHLAGQTPSDDVVTALTELRDSRAAISAQQDERAATIAQLEEQRQGLLSELADPEPTPAEPVVPAEPVATDPPAAAPAPAPVEPPAAPADTPPAAPVAAEPAPQVEPATPAPEVAVAASGRKAPIGTFTTPAAALPANPALIAKTVITAAGGAPGYPQGREITSSADLAEAMTARLRSLSAGGGGTGEKLYVAHADTTYPEDRTLRTEDWAGNFAKIEKATGPKALVAAGGLCAPLQTLYDVEVIGSSDRPIRDALARFTVDRGGIQFRPNSSAATALTTGTGTGVDVWSLAQDASVTSVKTCYVVDCPGITTATIDAVYLCLEFSNITTRFDPETTAANIRQGDIAHARLAENNLLRQLNAGSKVLSAARVIGATRDILANLDHAVAYYRNRHRIDSAVMLTFMIPAWVRYLMRTDIARQMAAGDWMLALAVTDAMIDAWFASRAVNPVWHLDGEPPAGGTNEVQTVTITGTPTGGSFTLTYSGQTTAAIAYNATAAAVLVALQGLSNVRPNDLIVGGGPGPGTAWTVAFGGQYAGTNVAQMTSTDSLTGGSSPASAVTTTTGGAASSTVNSVAIASQVYANASAGAAIPGYPDQIDSLLFVTGTKLFLDGGSLDLGLVRDSTLNSRNRYRQFNETFEGIADRGIENLRLVMTVQPTGQTSGTADLSSIVD